MQKHLTRNGARKLRNVRVEPPDELPLSERRRRIVDITAVVLLSLMVVLLGGKQIGRGGFGWGDAPIHAMDGVFVHDLVWRADWDRGLMTWAGEFYARYPCLGLVVHYPPLHPVVEAGVYSVFGIRETVARATVVLFGVVAVLGLYWLGVQLFGRPGALVSAGLFATAPFGLIWLRDVMLEWPAVALAILAVGCYRAWYRHPCWKWAILGGLATSAAILTKQTTVFLLAVFPVHLTTVVIMSVLRGDWPPEPEHRRHESDLKMAMTVATAALIVLVLIGLYDAFSSRFAEFSRFLVTGRPPWLHLRYRDTYLQYFRWFDEIYGKPMLIITLVGLAVIVARWEWRGIRLPILWLVMVWVQQTLIAWKEPRYFFFALPATALLAGRGWTLWPRWRRFPLGFIPIALFIGVQFIVGMATSPKRLPDYAPAVQKLVDLGDADVVLMDGVRDGQFIFDVRTNPQAADRIITLRGSKVLYSRAARGRWRHTTHRGTPEEILELLDEYGIRYIVVESELPAIPTEARADWDDAAGHVLRNLLVDTTRFELVESWPLRCDDPIWDDVELRLYRYRDAPPRTSKTITLPIPVLGREITVDLP